MTLDSLRKAVGVVFQESLLFNRSIRENLLVGKPEASDAELENACRLAEAMISSCASHSGTKRWWVSAV